MGAKITLAVLLSILLMGIASAGTVSLTGTCHSNLLPGNMLNFTLANTGNDTAYNLALFPKILGATTPNLSYTANALPPDSSAIFLFPLYNMTRLGTYVDDFAVTYQQGSQAFTALFPCPMNLGTSTVSQVFLTVNTLSSGGTTIMNVSAVSGINSNLTVNVSALFPPTFKFITVSSYHVRLGPYATAKMQFVVQYPTTQGSYSGAVSDQYVLGNLSYASSAPVTISQASPSAQVGWISPFNIGSVTFVGIFILLMARSVLRNRKKRNAPPENSA